MINEYLKIFNLDSYATLNDVKKAYRKLAKQNHPDLFMDEDKKKNQEIIMVKINEPYKIILSNFKNVKDNIKFERSKEKSEIKNDYMLYKKGIEYYNIYFDSFFSLFSKRAVKTLREKETNLIKARSYFTQLLQEYPNSNWGYDSEEKLKKIIKTIETLNNTKDLYKKTNLKDSKHY